MSLILLRPLALNSPAIVLLPLTSKKPAVVTAATCSLGLSSGCWMSSEVRKGVGGGLLKQSHHGHISFEADQLEAEVFQNDKKIWYL